MLLSNQWRDSLSLGPFHFLFDPVKGEKHVGHTSTVCVCGNNTGLIPFERFKCSLNKLTVSLLTTAVCHPTLHPCVSLQTPRSSHVNFGSDRSSSFV